MKRIAVLFVISMVILQEVVFAANWIWVYSSDTVGYYIDASSVKRCTQEYKSGVGTTLYTGPSATHIMYWDKKIFEDESERIKVGRNFQKSSYEDYSDFYYLIVHEECDKVNGTVYCRTLFMTAYDFDGNVIESTAGPSPWQPLPPDSIGEYVYEIARQYAR